MTLHLVDESIISAAANTLPFMAKVSIFVRIPSQAKIKSISLSYSKMMFLGLSQVYY
jgi:hypothetical protein